jgi:hypothetical protein
MKSKNDAELVHLARAGNRDAYSELIQRYQHPIWGLLNSYVPPRKEYCFIFCKMVSSEKFNARVRS